MSIFDEERIARHIGRNDACLIIEHNAIHVDSTYKFNMDIDGQIKYFFIRHFAIVESLDDGQTWGFIDFLDEHFSQKRGTIINNVCKCLNIKKNVD